MGEQCQAGGELFRVTLRAEGPGPPAAIRLRQWLKGALRRAGLRAVKVEPVEPAKQSESEVQHGKEPV